MDMIRENSILLKIKNEGTPDLMLLERTLKKFRPAQSRCPVCGASFGGSRKLRTYPRMMISAKEGTRLEEVVQIPLYKCPSCGHSHAILPDVLIPFGSYSLRFILTILKDYLNRSCTVRRLCENWQIAVSTLYSWIHCFAEHFSVWRSILFRITWVTKQAMEDVAEATAFPSSFFRRFGFSFLQLRSTSHFLPVAEKPGGS